MQKLYKLRSITHVTRRGASEFGLSNTNKLIRFYPGATGLKTGFTTGAGYCLSASAQREGMELVAVVMGAKTSQARNAACKELLDYGFANFAVIAPSPETSTGAFRCPWRAQRARCSTYGSTRL